MPLPVQSIDSAAVARVPGRDAVARPEKQSAEERSRAQLNVSIVQSAHAVSISTGNEPMALLLQSAIDGINEKLKPEFGDNALQAAMSQDNTPEGTAGRIVALSTGFFEAFKAKYPNVGEADALQDFMATIRSGFEQGYTEAVDILKGLQVFSGDIASNIEKTYALVQQGYADFEAAQVAKQAQPAESKLA